MSHFPEDTGQFELEPVERRGDLRGYVYGVEAEVAGGPRAPVSEGSRRGLFVEIAEPDEYSLRDAVTVRVYFQDLAASMTTLVVRKEVEPRSGLGLRVVKISAEDDEIWEQILTGAQKGGASSG